VSAETQPVADLLLTNSDAKEIWDKLVSVYEQTSNQRLNPLMTDFFKLGSIQKWTLLRLSLELRCNS
jgi:hypothetical protein